MPAVRRQDGVAVGVLRVHPLQGQPAADVVPAVRGLQHQHFAGVLHDGVVDADLLHPRVLGPQHFVPARRIPGGGDALDGRGQCPACLRRSSSRMVADLARRRCRCSRSIRRRRRTARPVPRPASRGTPATWNTGTSCRAGDLRAAVDVAVAGGREGRRDAEGDRARADVRRRPGAAARTARRNSCVGSMTWSAGVTSMTASGSRRAIRAAPRPMHGAVSRPHGSPMMWSAGRLRQLLRAPRRGAARP